jgi:uncharacterized integral membrane protein
MFASAIRLRYIMPKVERPFAIGKHNNAGIWFVSGVGFLASLLAFILSFIPPAQISTGNNTVWYSVLIIGTIISVIIPLIIYSVRKPSWRDPKIDFKPFHWQQTEANK